MLWCDANIVYITVVGVSTTNQSTSATSTRFKEPLYYILERPLLCDSCLREEEYGEAPSLPPRDVPTSSRSRVPFYERVGSFKRPREPLEYECAEGKQCISASLTPLPLKMERNNLVHVATLDLPLLT